MGTEQVGGSTIARTDDAILVFEPTRYRAATAGQTVLPPGPDGDLSVDEVRGIRLVEAATSSGA